MWRYSILALALVAGLWSGGAAAAQQIVVPDDFDMTASKAAATTGAVATVKPARPTSLQSRALSTTESVLTWNDTARNESEFRLDVRWDARPWEELGSIPANAKTLFVVALEPGTTYFFRLRALNAAGFSAYSNEAAVTAFYEPGSVGGCAPQGGVMCLGGGRYRVTATYEGNGQKGKAGSTALSSEAGYFYFFSPGNVEVLVKVIDGCALNERGWVFTSGLTNMRVLMVVTDTKTGATSTYLSEAGRAFPAIQDTQAFATCGT
jgi:hypothetical protein